MDQCGRSVIGRELVGHHAKAEYDNQRYTLTHNSWKIWKNQVRVTCYRAGTDHQGHTPNNDLKKCIQTTTKNFNADLI